MVVIYAILGLLILAGIGQLIGQPPWVFAVTYGAILIAIALTAWIAILVFAFAWPENPIIVIGSLMTVLITFGILLLKERIEKKS